MPWRQIFAETFKTFGALSKIDSEGKPISVGFRYPNGDVKVRLIDQKEFYLVKNSSNNRGLFGRDRFAAGSNKTLILTEGELDALSLWQVLRVPVASVRSASSAVADCTVDRSWCNSFERIVLAFDGDTAGKEASHRVARLFDPNRLLHLKFDGRRKDANEYLQHGEEEELKNLFWNAKRYMPENIRSSFSDFKKILEETPREGIPYPFPTLTKMTYGIRTGESVLITAMEGIGKTELMRTILYTTLQRTDYNVGSFFLEEQTSRHLLGLAGIHLQAPVHLPDSGYSQAEIISACESAIQKDDRLYVFDHFGSGDPGILCDTIRFLAVGCGVRVVLVDHVGMVVSGDAPQEDERRRLDYLMTQLEMLSKELDLALIVVSHVNDDGLTRGSRYISKIADIRIDVSRDILSLDPIERNTSYLTISKNRFSGQTGPAGRIYFDPVTHIYRELEDGEQVETSPGRATNDNVAARQSKAA